MTALRGTFQPSTDSWAWSHSVQKQHVAHRCLLSSGCPKEEKKNYFSRMWSKSMLLNSPSASDEKQQSHGQAGDPSKDLRLPQLDLDLIKQVLWVGEALVLSSGWEVKDMCLYRKKGGAVTSTRMWNFHSPWGGFSELMHPCSCVCKSISDAQLSWDQRQVKTVMLLVVSFFPYCSGYCVNSFLEGACISKQHHFVKLSHFPKRRS